MSQYAFGPFKLDVERLLLLHEGEPVALGPKVVETLLALIEHPGDVLTKTALLERIWPEGFVEEANLAQNIYVLRKTLRTHWDVDAIETVPRRGYRFLPAVQLVEAPAPTAPEIVVERRPARFVRFVAALAAGVIIAMIVAGVTFAAMHRPKAVAPLSDEGARLYVIARYYWNLRSEDGMKRSLQYFARVVDTDPHDARGYAGLAEAYAMMAEYRYGPLPMKVYLSRAEEYADKALAVDSDSAEAHAAMGLIDIDQQRSVTAIAELRRAIAIDPSYGPAHEWYGVTLLARGDVAESMHQLQIAADLDPLSVATTAWLGSVAYLDRRFDDAIAYSRQALDLSPKRADVYTVIGEAYEAEGNYARAVEAFKRYQRSGVDARAEGAALLAHVYALQHRRDEALQELAYARAHVRDVEPSDLALALAASGQRTVALEILRHLRAQVNWTAVQNDPRFDLLRADAEFRQLAAPA